MCFQRAFRYLQQAADAGNSNAMAYLGKVSHYVHIFVLCCIICTILNPQGD